jgi:hypothetical protein
MPKLFPFAVTLPSGLMNDAALAPPAPVVPAVLAFPAAAVPTPPAPPIAGEPAVPFCPPPAALALPPVLGTPAGPGEEEHAIETSAMTNQASRLIRPSSSAARRVETFSDECTQEPPMRK